MPPNACGGRGPWPVDDIRSGRGGTSASATGNRGFDDPGAVDGGGVPGAEGPGAEVPGAGRPRGEDTFPAAPGGTGPDGAEPDGAGGALGRGTRSEGLEPLSGAVGGRSHGADAAPVPSSPVVAPPVLGRGIDGDDSLDVGPALGVRVGESPDPGTDQPPVDPLDPDADDPPRASSLEAPSGRGSPGGRLSSELTGPNYPQDASAEPLAEPSVEISGVWAPASGATESTASSRAKSSTRGTVADTGGISVRLRRRRMTAPTVVDTAATAAPTSNNTYFFDMPHRVPGGNVRC